MKIDGWKYYQYAAIPTSPPHELPNLEPIEDKTIWKLDGKPLLARWTTDWDCEHETKWWYVIKDTPFDISTLKAKRRYEINKGNKNFTVRKINSADYKNELYEVTVAAYSGWPEKYRPSVEKGSFFRQVEDWSVVFGGFHVETQELCGYALLRDYGSYVDFAVLRTEPEMEKLAINAAMVAGILKHYADRFDGSFYVCDGSRAIRHETAFQDYLEKYFEFKKVFCKLNLKYKAGFGAIVKILYPFRGRINAESKLGSKISGLLLLEEINRQS